MSENVETTTTSAVTEVTEAKTDPIVEQERSEKILKAKELYNQGSRNFLIKSYTEAADELSQVCALYEELYGELSPELGMPYLLYAKSLIALAVDENKVIDVPDEVDEDDEEDVDEDEEEGGENNENETPAEEKANNEAESTKANSEVVKEKEAANANADEADADSNVESSTEATNKTKTTEESQVSSSNDDSKETIASAVKNGNGHDVEEAAASTVADGEKPSTSNGDAETVDTDMAEDEEENDVASNLQLAWEILELAAKIFSRQGLSGLPNLAEVQTELANIEFENNIMDSAREDYEKALKIYKDLPKNYHRAMAEIHYKIGLTYLMQQMNKEGATSLKEACDLIEAEIADIKSKEEELTEKDKNNIQDMEETKQEIKAKIDEIEETQAQNIAEVRAALDSYIKPIVSQNADGASSSSSSKASEAKSGGSSSNITSSSPSSKPKDISHLIKRKKPEEPSSEAEASPAKRPAV